MSRLDVMRHIVLSSFLFSFIFALKTRTDIRKTVSVAVRDSSQTDPFHGLEIENVPSTDGRSVTMGAAQR